MAPAPEQTIEQTIEQILTNSLAGWSSGDLNRLMAAYDPEPVTTLVTSASIISGFDAIRAAYASAFESSSGVTGTGKVISFDVRKLGADHALVTARLEWIHPDGGKLALATMVLRRTDAGWRITSDHTA